MHAPDDCTTVVGGATSEGLAAAVSAQLFESAPVVVVAPAVDGPALRDAAEQATRLGAPLLLAGESGSAATSAAKSSTR